MIPQELYDEISKKAHHSAKALRIQNLMFQKKKIKDLEKIDVSYTTLLQSGQSSISRFSMDLVKRQRNARGQLIKEEKNNAMGHEYNSNEEIANFIHLNDDDDLLELDAFLESLM